MAHVAVLSREKRFCKMARPKGKKKSVEKSRPGTSGVSTENTGGGDNQRDLGPEGARPAASSEASNPVTEERAQDDSGPQDAENTRPLNIDNQPEGDENGDMLTERQTEEEGDDSVWTVEREDRLIDLFEACVFLYDKTAPGFQLRHKKEMAIRRFAGILGVTGMYKIPTVP